MIDRALKPLVTPPKYTERDVKRLAVSDKEFDLAVLRSTLVFVNLTFGFVSKDRPTPTPELLARCVSWIPETSVRRAERLRIDPQVIKSQFRQTYEADLQQQKDPGFVLLDRATAVANALNAPHYRAHGVDWLNKEFRALTIYTALRADETGIHEVRLPILNTINAVFAYAIALVHTDRHQLYALVRSCPYGGPERTHLFLDYRMKGGTLNKGRPQVHCCDAHGNRARVARATAKSREHAAKHK